MREDRDALERLARYGLRAAFSQERLSLREDGKVLYELVRPWPNSAGVTELVLDPIEFLQRLAALIPAPYTHLLRRHGVFAGRSKFRWRLPVPPKRLLPEGVEPEEVEDRSGHPSIGSRRSGRQTYSWAQLLYRVFFVNALLCPKCGGKMKVLAFLTDPAVIERILLHLDLPTTPPPVLPARVEWDSGAWEGSDPSDQAVGSGHGGEWEWESGEERAPP